jgi:hypothetical protein
MEPLGGRGSIALLIHYLDTRLGWVVSVTPRPRFTPGTHCTGGWVGPRASLDTEVREKVLCPCRGLNLDRPVVQPIARHCTDWATRLHLISRHRSGIRLEGLRKTAKNISQDSRSLGWDLNLGPSEYEAVVLITRPKSSTTHSWIPTQFKF